VPEMFLPNIIKIC